MLKSVIHNIYTSMVDYMFFSFLFKATYLDLYELNYVY